MALPSRQAQGPQSITVASPNLFDVAAQYLGDATQWIRIWRLNFPGQAPEFLIAGIVTLQLPAPNATADF